MKGEIDPDKLQFTMCQYKAFLGKPKIYLSISGEIFPEDKFVYSGSKNLYCRINPLTLIRPAFFLGL